MRVKIPTADVYDMFSTVNTLEYEVLKPNGDIESGILLERSFFKADQYGQYSVRFIAKNTFGKTRSVEYPLYVLDKGAPRIQYLGEMEITCSAGESVKFDSAKAFDSVDEEPKLYVFVVEKDLGVKDITNILEYTFTQKGVYTVRYYACDESYNHDIVNVTVIVKWGFPYE